MRSLALSLILLLVAAATAQSSVHHATTVVIPPTLKLRLDGAATLGAAGQALRVDLAEGGAVVQHGDLEIFANVPWQLSVAFVPASADDGLALRARAFSGGWIELGQVQRSVAVGGPTGGWRASGLEVALAGVVPSEGSYSGTLVTTLSQP